MSAYTNAQKATFGAIAIVIVGSFLPWASVFGVSVSGIQGEGVATFALSGVGLLVLILGRDSSRRSVGYVQAFLALLVGLVVIVDWSQFAAFGLYLVAIGAVVWLGCAMLVSGETRRESQPPEPPSVTVQDDPEQPV